MARSLDGASMSAENSRILHGTAPRARGTREGGTRDMRSARKRKDKFHVPPELIPKGWCVEWKRTSCLGKPEEFDYEMDLYESGWKRADPKTFHTLVPEGFTGDTVERGGMRLYIRPSHQKKESQRLDRMEAENQVRDKLEEIGMTGGGEMDRKVYSFDRGYEGRPSSRMVPDDEGNEPYEEFEGSDRRPGGEEA